jgi:sugar lactone lactonase YvrE
MSEKPLQLIDTFRVGNTLGEGVQWDAAGQALWWTDIQARRLHRYGWENRTVESFDMPERVGSFGLIEGSDKIIAAFESGIALYDLAGGASQWLLRPGHSGVRFNDGRVDRQGRFWAGTMEEGEPRSGRGSLYCTDRDGRVHQRESGIMISNGLCWSLDGRTLYFADSALRTMYAYDANTADGTISNRRVFARTPEGAHPDGATIDADGYLWSAQWGASRIARYAPSGKLDRIFDVPVSQPTCLAFGGPNLDHLFVTSARDGLSGAELAGQSGAGDIFVYKVEYRGVPENRYIHT